MVESDLHVKKAENAGTEETESQDQVVGFQRDPSFSGWCDENGVLHSSQLGSTSASPEKFDFSLPLVAKSHSDDVLLDRERHRLISKFEPRMEGGAGINDASRRDIGKGNSNYVPFDMENGSEEDRMYSNAETTPSSYTDYREQSGAMTKSPISVAEVLKTLILILAWYTFSTFLTLYNKTLLGDHLGKFPAPLLMNTIHFTMQAVLSKGITWFWSDKYQPAVIMSWRDYFVRVVPTALGTALDVNLSNESLVFISVTFATMCKSAAPIFLLLFAFAFRLESPSVKLLGIIIVISFGILLTVAKDTEFEFWGFILVMLSSVMAGFRWTMTQILLQKETYGLKNPMTLMSYVAPVMAIATALMSLVMDPWSEFRESNYFDSSWHIMRSCLLLLFGGALAFFMVMTEYILVSVTSAVTVTIAGVVKEAVTILVAVFYFHDEFTFLKGIGLATIMFGVGLFNWYKYQKLQKGERSEDEIAGSLSNNKAAKYVILDELDDEDEEH